jgi:hypothetical protein
MKFPAYKTALNRQTLHELAGAIQVIASLVTLVDFIGKMFR